MNKCYKKSFLTKVVARIDFTSKIDVPTKGLSKESSEKILKKFPIQQLTSHDICYIQQDHFVLYGSLYTDHGKHRIF